MRNVAMHVFTVLCCLLVVGCVPREGRGIWVVRYRLASPPVVDEIVTDAHRARFNLLFVQIHGRGDAYYRSLIDPRSEALEDASADYDPLGYVLDGGHAAGLHIHAWLNAFYVWPYPPPYPLSAQHVVIRNPGWLILDEEGRNLAQYTPDERAKESAEGLYLDPANTYVRDYVVEVCKEVVSKYDVDGVHLDYIRYPGARWGFNEEAVETFIGRWGVDPRLLSPWLRRAAPDRFIRGMLPLHLRWHYYYHSLWAETRSYYITELVRTIREELKTIKPRVIVSAAVFPDPQVAYYAKGQDWPTWLSRGYIDLIVPMAYHGDASRVAEQIGEAQRRAERGMVFAGLGAWRKAPAQIREEVEKLREMGIKGFSYFSYQGMKDYDAAYVTRIRKAVQRRQAAFPALNSENQIASKPVYAPWVDDGTEVLWRSLKKQFFSLDAYRALLNDLGLDENAVPERLRKEVALFERLTAEVYPKARPFPDEVVLLPPSVDVEAISQYVHPEDGEQTRHEAYMAIQDAYRRLSQGEEFGEVARDHARRVGVARGPRQERVYLQDGWDLAEIVASMREGESTPVIEMPNGYSIYKIVEFHPPERKIYGELPWSLKRLVFQTRFRRIVELEY